jgi:predicted ATP-dependent serine protease
VAFGEISLTGEVRPGLRSKERVKASEKLGLNPKKDFSF